MYKKITHNIVEEHFDHPAVVPKAMFRPEAMPSENKPVDQIMETTTTTTDSQAIEAFEYAVEKLWEQHSEYARSAMISIFAGLEDTDVVSARLMRNQEELGAAVIPFYGEAAGSALTGLLKDCVNTAVDIFKAIKDSRSITDLEIKWDNTATALARFLDTADATNWPYDTVLSVLKDKHANSLKQAKARYAKDWTADIEANDASCFTTHALAETFSSGIINKFPEQFTKQYTSESIKKK